MQQTRVLTLWQLWATFKVLGIKKYETRHWAATNGIPLFIHAAKRPMRADDKLIYSQVKEELEQLKQEWPELVLPELPEISALPYGAVLAKATLEACLIMVTGFEEMRPGKIAINHQSKLERLCGNWKPGRFAWSFSELMQFEQAIAFSSRQGRPLAPDELV
jgi:activating signal cointegrator 1